MSRCRLESLALSLCTLHARCTRLTTDETSAMAGRHKTRRTNEPTTVDVTLHTQPTVYRRRCRPRQPLRHHTALALRPMCCLRDVARPAPGRRHRPRTTRTQALACNCNNLPPASCLLPAACRRWTRIIPQATGELNQSIKKNHILTHVAQASSIKHQDQASHLNHYHSSPHGSKNRKHTHTAPPHTGTAHPPTTTPTHTHMRTSTQEYKQATRAEAA